MFFDVVSKKKIEKNVVMWENVRIFANWKEKNKYTFKQHFNMKKTFAIVGLIAIFAVMAASCTHHTCPAYRGSISEVVE